MPRFDEVELQPSPSLGLSADLAADGAFEPPASSPAATEAAHAQHSVAAADSEFPLADAVAAPLIRRGLAILTDLSLFVALTLTLAPLLPDDAAVAQLWSVHPAAVASLLGFVIVLSYYYFVGSWLLWGKTLGGAIFDVKVVGAETATMRFRSANRRWSGVVLSILTCGLGFLIALLPSRRSLSDRISGTRCVVS